MPADMALRCVVYARVSKEDQSNWSLETQAERCIGYATGQGWTVDEVFIDDGESGTTTDRTQFQRMLKHLKARRGRIQFVVVYALSRFARNLEDHLGLRRELNVMGIRLRSVTEHLDESPDGFLREGVSALFADHYSRALSARVLDGMRAAVARGRWPWRAVVGYRNARGPDGRPTFEHDPDRAPLMRQAFEMAADGRAPEEILRHLRAHGLTTKRGNQIGAKVLAKLLRNPVYAGELRVKGWAVEGTAAFVPIVDPALFRRAQAALRRKSASPAPQQHNPEFPLRGLVACACGRKMVGYYAAGRRARYAYYECQACKVREPRDRMEQAFVQLLEQIPPPPEIAEAWRAEVLDVLHEEEQAVVEQSANLMRRAAALRERKTSVAMLLMDGKIDQETHEDIRGKAQAELDDVEAILSQAQRERVDVAGLLDYAIEVITTAKGRWLEANTEQRVAMRPLLFPNGLTWSRANGFHRTGVTCLDSWMSEDSSAIESRLVGQPSPGSNRLGRLETLLRTAEQLRRVMPLAA